MNMPNFLRPVEDWDGMVFENRNRSYGAFVLRRSYDGTMLRAWLYLLGAIALTAFITGSGLFRNATPPLLTDNQNDTIQFTEVELPPLPDEPQAKQQPEARHQQSQQPTHIGPDDQPPAPEPDSTYDPNQQPDPGTSQPGTAGTTGTTGSGPAETKTEEGSDADNATVVAQVMPEFPGGFEALQNYLRENLRFNNEASENFDKIRVVVSFIVDPDGRLLRIEPITHNGYGTEEAVTQVLRDMPKWKPGRQGDKKVYVKMMMPVSYEFH